MEVRSDNFLLEVARGKVKGAKIINKFGSNRNVTSSWSTVCSFGGYETPATPVSLEILSSSALDNIAGSGARTVEIYGLDENWDAITYEVEMNGTTPVVIPQQFLRVYRMHVNTSGTYAALSSPSHAGTITLRVAGGGSTYAQIVIENGFPLGSSEIGCFSVPRGHTAFIVDSRVVMEAAKLCDVAFFFRKNADIVSGGTYSPMFILDIMHDVSNIKIESNSKAFSRPLVGPCDVGFLTSTTSGTAQVSVTYCILVLDNNLMDDIVSRY